MKRDKQECSKLVYNKVFTSFGETIKEYYSMREDGLLIKSEWTAPEKQCQCNKLQVDQDLIEWLEKMNDNFHIINGYTKKAKRLLKQIKPKEKKSEEIDINYVKPRLYPGKIEKEYIEIFIDDDYEVLCPESNGHYKKVYFCLFDCKYNKGIDKQKGVIKCGYEGSRE
jgi:hypothetical protein